ncbi:MAG TPA: Asp-tRNA(Asn)/Glu-tRNA(Gln) amidotransferase subunit GatA [Clostridia bacterium]|nr:Asp-tRNA(Asn)/Glu-tRNA(Gln) amidotransferase subunit GatA [Clostridia bacterium]
MSITHMSVKELSKRLALKEISAVETAQSYLRRMESVEPKVGAYLSIFAESAMEQAKKIDERRGAGEPLNALAGVPAALKDNLCTAFGRTTCASKMLEDFRAPYDATAVKLLSGAGAVFLGKTNMDEFAMGSSTENSAFQLTKNPRDLHRVPGGSSGGSAAAVAADEAAYALGSDTGGSIRQPAAFCGVVGMKPTYGRVSRYGLIAFASSLDQIGPFTKTVEDCAFVLDTLCAHDEKDSTSVAGQETDFTAALCHDVKGMRLALPKELFGVGVGKTVRKSVLAAANRFEDLGAHVEEISLPELSCALPAYYILSSAEASSNLGRFDGVRYGRRAKNCETLEELYLRSRSEGFGAEVKRRILLGTFALSAGYYDAYYKRSLQVRTLLSAAFDRVFAEFDAVLTPTAPTCAYLIGEKTSDPVSMYLGDICTVPVNIAGLPALSMPCGKAEGLPVGMQLIGKAFGEKTLLALGAAYERAYGACHMTEAPFETGGCHETV